MDLDKEMDRKEGLAFKLGNIGIVFEKKKNYDKALKYFNEALIIAYDGEFFEVTEAFLPQLIAIYQRQNNHEKIQELLLKFKKKFPQLELQ